MAIPKTGDAALQLVARYIHKKLVMHNRRSSTHVGLYLSSVLDRHWHVYSLW
jgi:hypothetical protein